MNPVITGEILMTVLVDGQRDLHQHICMCIFIKTVILNSFLVRLTRKNRHPELSHYKMIRRMRKNRIA